MTIANSSSIDSFFRISDYIADARADLACIQSRRVRHNQSPQFDRLHKVQIAPHNADIAVIITTRRIAIASREGAKWILMDGSQQARMDLRTRLDGA